MATTYGDNDQYSTESEVTGSKQPQGLPSGAKLVIVGNAYRVVWALGDGLGNAWYSISAEHLKNLYGSTAPPVDKIFDNAGAFSAENGNLYWGNIAEVSLKADTPWDDLKDQIFNQFGYVPGLDELEIKRLLIQAFYEGWSENQWTVEYRQTDYFNKLTDDQRAWVGLSEAEKKMRIEEQYVQLQEMHQSIWGPNYSINAANLKSIATKIASGQTSLASWEWGEKQGAAKIEGTNEWQRIRAQQEAALAEGNEEENLALAAQNAWYDWVGPVAMPEGFAQKWGADLASGKASEADLETYLKQISTSRWAYKPPELRWSDWSAPYKAQIKDELELVSLDDKDTLLTSLLNSDMTGQDLTQMIRQDSRFRSTTKMYGELSAAATDLGRRFGFIT